MNTGRTRSVWFGAVITLVALLVMSAFALVRGWEFSSWVVGALVSVVAGGGFALSQARRNRQIDELVDRAEES